MLVRLPKPAHVDPRSLLGRLVADPQEPFAANGIFLAGDVEAFLEDNNLPSVLVEDDKLDEETVRAYRLVAVRETLRMYVTDLARRDRIEELVRDKDGAGYAIVAVMTAPVASELSGITETVEGTPAAVAPPAAIPEISPESSGEAADDGCGAQDASNDVEAIPGGEEEAEVDADDPDAATSAPGDLTPRVRSPVVPEAARNAADLPVIEHVAPAVTTSKEVVVALKYRAFTFRQSKETNKETEAAPQSPQAPTVFDIGVQRLKDGVSSHVKNMNEMIAAHPKTAQVAKTVAIAGAVTVVTPVAIGATLGVLGVTAGGAAAGGVAAATLHGARTLFLVGKTVGIVAGPAAIATGAAGTGAWFLGKRLEKTEKKEEEKEQAAETSTETTPTPEEPPVRKMSLSDRLKQACVAPNPSEAS